MSACTLAFLLVLCIAIASADNKGRGEWLCGEVTKYALQHPGKNVIAFAAGDYKLNGPATAVELTYEGDGCEHVTRLGSSVLGDSGKPIDAVVENFVPGAGKKMGDAALKWVLPCRKYKMVAFVDGTFTRYGDGGYENWCFTGKKAVLEDPLLVIH